jgi:nitric oxide reductase activation protein
MADRRDIFGRREKDEFSFNNEDRRLVQWDQGLENYSDFLNSGKKKKSVNEIASLLGNMFNVMGISKKQKYSANKSDKDTLRIPITLLGKKADALLSGNQTDVFYGTAINEAAYKIAFTNSERQRVDEIKAGAKAKNLPNFISSLLTDEYVHRDLSKKFPGYSKFVQKMKADMYKSMPVVEVEGKSNIAEILDLTIKLIRYPKDIDPEMLIKYEPLVSYIEKLFEKHGGIPKNLKGIEFLSDALATTMIKYVVEPPPPPPPPPAPPKSKDDEEEKGSEEESEKAEKSEKEEKEPKEDPSDKEEEDPTGKPEEEETPKDPDDEEDPKEDSEEDPEEEDSDEDPKKDEDSDDSDDPEDKDSEEDPESDPDDSENPKEDDSDDTGDADQPDSGDSDNSDDTSGTPSGKGDYGSEEESVEAATAEIEEPLSEEEVEEEMKDLLEDYTKALLEPVEVDDNAEKKLDDFVNNLYDKDKAITGKIPLKIIKAEGNQIMYEYAMKDIDLTKSEVLRKLLSRKIKDYEISLKSMRSGRLDTNKLAEAVQHVQTIYEMHGLVTTDRICLGVLIDESGSMGGSKIDKARAAAIFIEQTFGKLTNCDLFIYGHSGDQSNYSGSTELYVYREPGFSQPFALGSVAARSQNRDGDAIFHTSERMRRFSKNPGILIVLSDGYPEAHNYSGKTAIEDTRHKVSISEKRFDLRIFQISLEDINSSSMFKHFVYMKNIKSLPQDLTKFLSSQMDKMLKERTTF